MKFNPQNHHRRSIRLKGYNYAAAGFCFVTICAHQRQCLFGEIFSGEMRLNKFGQIVAEDWLRSCDIRQEIDFDARVIMPNHLHGNVVIQSADVLRNSEDADDWVEAHGRTPLQYRIVYWRPRSLSLLIAGFKSATTKQINILRGAPKTPVWQRNYYEHIIRNEELLQFIHQYIHNNPLSWQDDQLHPENPSD